MNQYSKNKIITGNSELSLEQARELYPEWYEKRIEKGLPKRTWECHTGLYEWWLSRLPEIQVGHRYHYMLCLAAYAQKCGIDEDKLAHDMALCRKELDKISPADNPLTIGDMAKALQAHQERYRTLPRRKIAELSGVEIQGAKRNGRPQAVHLERARAVENIDYPKGEWRNKSGAPTKKDIVLDYASKHPGANITDIARGCGVSRPTVYKWLKPILEATKKIMVELDKQNNER